MPVSKSSNHISADHPTTTPRPTTSTARPTPNSTTNAPFITHKQIITATPNSNGGSTMQSGGSNSGMTSSGGLSGSSSSGGSSSFGGSSGGSGGGMTGTLFNTGGTGYNVVNKGNILIRRTYHFSLVRTVWRRIVLW